MLNIFSTKSDPLIAIARFTSTGAAATCGCCCEDVFK